MTNEAKVFGMPSASGRWLFVVLGLIMNVCLGAVYAYSIFLGPVKKAFRYPPHSYLFSPLWFS